MPLVLGVSDILSLLLDGSPNRDYLCVEHWTTPAGRPFAALLDALIEVCQFTNLRFECDFWIQRFMIADNSWNVPSRVELVSFAFYQTDLPCLWNNREDENMVLVNAATSRQLHITVPWESSKVYSAVALGQPLTSAVLLTTRLG